MKDSGGAKVVAHVTSGMMLCLALHNMTSIRTQAHMQSWAKRQALQNEPNAWCGKTQSLDVFVEHVLGLWGWSTSAQDHEPCTRHLVVKHSVDTVHCLALIEHSLCENDLHVADSPMCSG